MLVVALHPHFTLAGGAGKFVLETGSRLAARGFRVLVVCIRAREEIVGPYRGRIEFREIGGPLSSSLRFWLTFPWRCLRVWRELPRERFVLFPQVFPANWWGFLYKVLHPGVPLVWMCQEPSAFIHSRAWLDALPAGPAARAARALNPLLRSLDVRLARRADRVFANSLATRQDACRVYGYAPNQVRVCYPGVDVSVFRADPAVAREDRVITVGRLTRFKNVDAIVRAVAALNRTRRTPVRLTIVGRGEEEDGLRRLVGDLGLERVVTFAGALSEEALVRALQSAKVFALASSGEPFGIVAVEAMACGTPCVVQGSGGPAETVLDGLTGYHVPGPDPDAYAAKIGALIDDDGAFAAMSAQAALRARRFSWEAAADTLAEGFEEFRGN